MATTIGGWRWTLLAILVHAWVGSVSPAGQSQPTSQPEKQVPCIYLHTRPTHTAAKKLDGGILLREIPRQALLIAARDELGLATRDMTLCESVPEDFPAAQQLDMDVLVAVDVGVTIDIFQGIGAEAKKLHHVFVPTPSEKVDYETLIENAARFSRREFVELLESLALPVSRPSPMSMTPVPADIERQLRIMTFPVQYAAVRRLHELVRRDGPSPDLVGGLVRGYAHLGQLTKPYWNSSHDAFMARALLYAERLVMDRPDSADSLWHRAYARTLVGLHATAMEDLAAARKLAGLSASSTTASAADAGTGERGKLPTWVAVLERACRCDTAGLMKIAADDPDNAQLAGFLATLTTRSENRPNYCLRIAEPMLEMNPECYRVMEDLAVMVAIGLGHRFTTQGPLMFAEHLPRRLAELPDLPDSVRAALPARREQPGLLARLFVGDKASEGEDESLVAGLFLPRTPRIVTALLEAGMPERDQSEPSWAVLGRMIEETLFMHVTDRACFMRYTWSVETEDFLDEVTPLVEAHQYAVMIESMKDKYRGDRSARMDLFANVQLRDASLKMRRLINRMRNLQGEVKARGDEAYERQWYHLDATADELETWCKSGDQSVQEKRLRGARGLREVSPHAPLAIALMLEDDWANTAKSAEAWEEQYGQHPRVLSALARGYRKAERLEDAKRCLRKYIQISPDRWAACTLAYLCRTAGDVGGWQDILDEYLATTPDANLDHTFVREDIANYYMSQGEFEKALPYAERAAESWSGRPMLCAANCREGLRQWDRAALWMQRVSDRYARSSGFKYLLWCARTGHGDRQAAARMGLEWATAQPPSTIGHRQLGRISLVYQLCGKLEEARKARERCFDRWGDPYSGHHVVVLAELVGDTRVRDRWLKKIVTRGARFKYSDGTGQPELVELARMFSRCLEAGEVTSADVVVMEAQIEATDKDHDKGHMIYFVGRFLDSHGPPDVALSYLKRVANYPLQTLYTAQLAREVLRRRGVESDIIPPRVKAREW